jgi:hypothetical protein
LVIENLRGGEFSVNCSFPHPGCTYWFFFGFSPGDRC